MKYLAIIFCIVIVFSNNALAQQSSSIPSWVKENAKLWHENSIGDTEFMKGIQYLIEQKIINISETQKSSQSTQYVPLWVKNIAGFWTDGKISDEDFTNAIEYLVKIGIIQVEIVSPQTSTPSSSTPPGSFSLQNTTSTTTSTPPTLTKSTVTPTLPMLMLTSKTDYVYMKYPYNLVVKIFDPKTNPDKNFDQFSGGISGVNITMTLLRQNNQIFAQLSGKTDDKGIYQGGVVIPYSTYKTEQWQVIVNATKNGYATQSATMFFATFYHHL